MTVKKTAKLSKTNNAPKARKLTLKKDTLKDLAAESTSKGIKGGYRTYSVSTIGQ